jgi:lipopolysaccharide/colanic/teichoic acid biosynthesis glycosyltransferase
MTTDLRIGVAHRAGVTERLDHAAKRAIDLVLAGLALALLLPVMVAIAIAVRLTSPGPALFRQVRVGHLRKPFVMLKFRSMYEGCDDAVHRAYVTRMLTGDTAPADPARVIYKVTGIADPRMTPIGWFLRKASLDELPQLINVLRGEMSLVGPRPALPWEVELFEQRHHLRFAVKPGITGLWQTSGRSMLTMRQALDLDVEYVRRRSFGLDLLIILKTARVLLAWRSGAR